MQSAEASTPAPTYGTPASSSRPCTVPSSPNGPCRTGKTTSTSASVAATPRRSAAALRQPARRRRALALQRCATPDRAPSPRRGRSRRVDDLVPRRLERLDHASRRGDARSSCSLERPPRTTAIRGSRRRSVVVVVVSVGRSSCGQNWPTVIVTSDAGLALGAALRGLADDVPVLASGRSPAR